MKKRLLAALLTSALALSLTACGGGTDSSAADGGDCTVVDLPKIGITGNSHFMFQEMNSDEIAHATDTWLAEHGLN